MRISCITKQRGGEAVLPRYLVISPPAILYLPTPPSRYLLSHYLVISPPAIALSHYLVISRPLSHYLIICLAMKSDAVMYFHSILSK